MCMKTGKGNKRRIIDIDSVKHQLIIEISDPIDIDDFCDSLVSLHAFTGCDTVSCFAGKGKSKAYSLLKNHSDYVTCFNPRVNLEVIGK